MWQGKTSEVGYFLTILISTIDVEIYFGQLFGQIA